MQCLGRVGGELADVEAGIATTHLVIIIIIVSVIVNLVIIVIVINLVIVVVINA